MKKQNTPYIVNSISELHRMWVLPKPQHPLVSIIMLDDIKSIVDERLTSVVYNFYSVILKRNCNAKVKYGQSYYDFDEGVMTFMSPGQVISTEVTDDLQLSGMWLIIHPDFIQQYPLVKTIKNYGYFSYATNEALHLSEKEEAMIVNVMKSIEQEYNSVIDTYSQDVIVSHIELLLNYCNRYYNRQFITRKIANNDLFVHLEKILTDYFDSDKVHELGLPTVQYISGQLHVSPNYLGDMLRNSTGQSTQQHIHNKLIEKAKEVLVTTTLSVSEIAYQLGFEYPQSFNKLFKNKMKVSPLEFRNSFN